MRALQDSRRERLRPPALRVGGDLLLRANARRAAVVDGRRLLRADAARRLGGSPAYGIDARERLRSWLATIGPWWKRVSDARHERARESRKSS